MQAQHLRYGFNVVVAVLASLGFHSILGGDRSVMLPLAVAAAVGAICGFYPQFKERNSRGSNPQSP